MSAWLIIRGRGRGRALRGRGQRRISAREPPLRRGSRCGQRRPRLPPRTPARAPRAWPPRGPREALLRWGPRCWFRSRASEEEPLGADGWQVPETPSPELSPRTRGDEALLPAGVLGSTRRRASEVLGVVHGPAAPASVTWALGQSDKPRPHPGPAELGTRGAGPRFPWRPWFRGSLTWGH